MITNKEDYIRYLRAEHPMSRSTNFFYLYGTTLSLPTHRFLLLLRTCEYIKNAKKGIFYRPLYFFFKYLKYRLGVRLNFTIPENVFEEGLQLPHYGTIVVNANARVGRYCRMHVDVNIGASGGSNDAPKIGDFVYFAPGAKVYGNITIADRIAIAANAAVAKSFLEPGRLIGGVPARDLGPVDIFSLIKTPTPSSMTLNSE